MVWFQVNLFDINYYLPTNPVLYTVQDKIFLLPEGQTQSREGKMNKLIIIMQHDKYNTATLTY